jgi:hypothetical protein
MKEIDMRDDRRRSLILAVGVATFASLLASGATHSQTIGKSVSPPIAAGKRDAMSVLEDLIVQLQSQVQDLNVQVKTLRANEQNAFAEVQDLRAELEETKTQLASLAEKRAKAVSNQTHSVPSESVLAVSSMADSPRKDQATDDRMARLEENLNLANAKINEQSQTKVESSSKYRVRLNGLLLLNLFANRGAVDSQDLPQIAKPTGLLKSAGTFGGSIRQSQIELQAFGPDVGGARTSAQLKFDFAGGFPQAPNGTTMGIARLRTGTVHFDWTDTSVIAGQDYLFFSPLSPTSYASLAVPTFSYSGNLWAWVPQVRVEHRFHASDSSTVLVQGGILESLSGDTPQTGYARSSTWGEGSGQPAYAARVSWNHQVFGQNVAAGLGGYYGRQSWGFGRSIDAWAGTADLTLPLGQFFEFTGQFYRGRAIGGLAGAIGQSVLWNGQLIDPATAIYGVNSMGGWVQLKARPTPKLEINAALGDDNPFSSDLREFSGNPVYAGSLLSKNMSSLVNLIYMPRSDMILSLEYRRLKTFRLDSNANAADHINVGIGYIF